MGTTPGAGGADYGIRCRGTMNLCSWLLSAWHAAYGINPTKITIHIASSIVWYVGIRNGRAPSIRVFTYPGRRKLSTTSFCALAMCRVQLTSIAAPILSGISRNSVPRLGLIGLLVTNGQSNTSRCHRQRCGRTSRSQPNKPPSRGELPRVGMTVITIIARSATCPLPATINCTVRESDLTHGT